MLHADEPAPFRLLNAAAEQPVLLACDHAAARLPHALGDLGLPAGVLGSHLAVDLGAEALASALATRLGFTAVLACYSRLAVDLNRELSDPQAFRTFGDGVVIAGNHDLSATEREARAGALYWPYHREVARQLCRLEAAAGVPALVSIHSFTPVMDGVQRPWEIGVLWDADRRLAAIFLEALRAAGFVVGDNQPYSGKSRAPRDFTIDQHAETAGLPNVLLEVRQDLLAEADSTERLATLFGDVLAALPATVFSRGTAAPPLAGIHCSNAVHSRS